MHIGTKASNLEKPTNRIRKHRFLKWFNKNNVVRSNLTSIPRFPVLCILAIGDIASYAVHYFGIYEASQVVLVVENPPANLRGNIRDAGSIPGSGRSPGGGNGNPLQYSCLENPMDRGAWPTMVHRVTESWTRLKQLSTAHSTHAAS